MRSILSIGQHVKFLSRLIATLILSGSVSRLVVAQPSLSVPPTEPGYLLVLGRTFDRIKVMNYSAALPAIYTETGGRYIGLGRATAGVTCVYGLCEGRSAVVARWDDYRNVGTFWWGDSYRKAVRLRDAAGVFTIVGIKGISGVVPFDSPGALLVATAAASSPDQQAWLDAAAKSGGRRLVPFAPEAVLPLEGDALYNRVALLSFESPAARAAFVASDATKDFVKSASGASLVSLIALIAIDVPPAAPSAAR
jgi:uncharacterized protein (DUF1330 family)